MNTVYVIVTFEDGHSEEWFFVSGDPSLMTGLYMFGPADNRIDP